MKHTRVGSIVNRVLSALFGVVVVRKSKMCELIERNISIDRSRFDLEFLTATPPSKIHQCLALLQDSKSQLRQDIFVLLELDFKAGGYFVEFGATNGIDLSNTYLLETKFNWTGILVEPAKIWHKELRRNRPLATIEELCVWEESNQNIPFRETDIPELSTVDLLEIDDEHSHERVSGDVYFVNSISLNDLLLKSNAPYFIDYLSIDTEGSEYTILKNFDFQKYSIKVITCEHNFTENREKVYALLTSNGYTRKFPSLSGFDDWYVLDTSDDL